MKEITNPNAKLSTIDNELIARDEKIVGIFFAAVAIQYYLHKDMLVNKLVFPHFLYAFSDIETYATQRVFIKDLIGNNKYSNVIEDMQSLFLEHSTNPTKNQQPYLLFLSRINKEFLISQIFNHNDQISEKYQFIEDFLGQEYVDLDKLNDKIWHFPTEQQILILARIYSTIHDNYEDKKKTILNSFKENVQRFLKEVSDNPNRYKAVQITNLKGFQINLDL